MDFKYMKILRYLVLLVIIGLLGGCATVNPELTPSATCINGGSTRADGLVGQGRATPVQPCRTI